ncbi:uncharacterized protein V1518DRAFT_417467 [Limtongia smithiae]|uniref:uncharacterized protein n=1 Tax=Limtongia smithiae TaxID=1125753 RepID=UPI0034CD4DDF
MTRLRRKYPPKYAAPFPLVSSPPSVTSTTTTAGGVVAGAESSSATVPAPAVGTATTTATATSTAPMSMAERSGPAEAGSLHSFPLATTLPPPPSFGADTNNAPTASSFLTPSTVVGIGITGAGTITHIPRARTPSPLLSRPLLARTLSSSSSSASEITFASAGSLGASPVVPAQLESIPEAPRGISAHGLGLRRLGWLRPPRRVPPTATVDGAMVVVRRNESVVAAASVSSPDSIFRSYLAVTDSSRKLVKLRLKCCAWRPRSVSRLPRRLPRCPGPPCRAPSRSTISITDGARYIGRPAPSMPLR